MPAKKDYPITIGGTVYLFRYNFDALTLIEDLLSRPFAEVLGESRLSSWKVVMFAGLQHNHPDLKLADLGNIIDDAESLTDLKLEVQHALLNSIGIKPKPEDATQKKQVGAASITQTGG